MADGLVARQQMAFNESDHWKRDQVLVHQRKNVPQHPWVSYQTEIDHYNHKDAGEMLTLAIKKLNVFLKEHPREGIGKHINTSEKTFAEKSDHAPQWPSEVKKAKWERD